MKLGKYRGEMMVMGVNARMRRLLGASISAVRPPRAQQTTSVKVPPGTEPPITLIEVSYSTHVKPDVFIPGTGWDLSKPVESWLQDEASE